MTIGIIYAMDAEGALIIKELADLGVVKEGTLEFNIGTIGNNRIIVCKGGIGKVNTAYATAMLCELFKPSLIINSGIAGGCSALEVKDVIVATEVGYSDFDLRVFGYRFGRVPNLPQMMPVDKEYSEKVKEILTSLGIKYKEAKILSADCFRHSRREIKNDIQGYFACDMEGASVAHIAYLNETPFVEVRFISDILDRDDHVADFNAFEKEASIQSSKVTLQLLKNL